MHCIHMGICDFISCISARVFRYVYIYIFIYVFFFKKKNIYMHRHRKRQPQMNVNLRLSNSGIPGIPGFAALWGSQEAIAQRMDFSQVAILQTVNSCQVLLHKLDSSQDVGQMENTCNIVWQYCIRSSFVLEDTIFCDVFFFGGFQGFNWEFFLSLLLRSDDSRG